MKIDANNPGSELAGETAAAMAAAAVVFQEVNATYAAELVMHAEELFDFADKYRGKYSDSIWDANSFYRSYGFNDELVWAAIWLYKATGDSGYLDRAVAMYDQFGLNGITGVYSWDDKTVGVHAMMAEALPDVPKYKQSLQAFCDHAVNGQQRSPKGQLFYYQWGSLRYASNAIFICLQAAELLPDRAEAYTDLAEGQMDYILGKTGRSFVVGYGTNPPLRPHHASSTCPDKPAVCDWGTYSGNQENAHVLYGALVGGPKDAYDTYEDIRTDFIMNEVATDYNAGFQGALAGLHMRKCM